jgi:response regulator RpfG family c-di-GMP phosphodiesterase
MSYLGQISLLLVDDESEIRHYLKRALQKHTDNITTAEDGSLALEEYIQYKPDIVLTDIRMPNKDGIELLKDIKQINQEQMVAIFSGSDDYEFLRDAINFGADKFFNKPVKISAFINELELLAKKVVMQKEHNLYIKILERSFDLEVSSSKERLYEFEQYQDAINKIGCIRKISPDGRVVFVNDKFSSLVGDQHLDEIAHDAFLLTTVDDKKIDTQSFISEILENGEFRAVIKHRTSDQREFFIDSLISSIKDLNGNTSSYFEVGNDVSDIFNLSKKIDKLNIDIVYILGSIAEGRNEEMSNHLKRVAAYSQIIAEKTKLTKDEIELLKRASPLHDIGKITIPDGVLNKQGALSKEEFEIVKEHPVSGYNILKSVDSDIFKSAAIISLEHHEKWDGSGYPKGLKGLEISTFGRITAVADVFDALTSRRCYKDAWSMDRALNVLKDGSGSHFDPYLIDIFFNSLSDIEDTFKAYQDV